MRYYEIIIYDKGGDIVVPRHFLKTQKNATYTSYIDGKSLPAALNVEIQAQVSPFNMPVQPNSSFVRIWGVSIGEISQSADLNDLQIVVKAGMQKGLPLANPKQNGVILQGRIWQSNGNWIGLDKTLDLFVNPTDVEPGPRNFAFIWKRGQTIEQPLKSTLGLAMPAYTPKVVVSSELVAQGDMVGSYRSLSEFATAIKKVTQQQQYKGIKTLLGNKYDGVNITARGKDLIAYDGTADYAENSYSKPLEVKFIDLVGQPTWITANQINFKTVMRADIKVGDYVKLPKDLRTPYVVTSPGSSLPGTPARDKLAFAGVFLVQRVYHWGNFRVPLADAWVSTFDAVFAPNDSTSTSSTNTSNGGGAAP